MMRGGNGMLLTPMTPLALPNRVQHPQVHERRDRGTFYWFFGYRQEEIGPDGRVEIRRKFHIVAPSRGAGAIGKRAAELKRDRFLLELNAPPDSLPPSHPPLATPPAVPP